MATVPKPDGFSVTQATLPSAQVAAPTTTDFGDKQTVDLGNAMQQTGQQVGSIATDMQNQVNTVRVIKAASDAKDILYDTLYKPETGLLQQKGQAALHRDSGVDLPTEYETAFKKQLDEISNGLGNGAQRDMFNQQAQQLQEQLRSTAMQHVGQEYKSFYGMVMDASVKTEQNAIAKLGANDPSKINPATGRLLIEESVDRIRAAVGEKARLAGMPQVAADVAYNEAVSGAHKMAVDAMLEQGKYDLTDTYRNKFKDQLTPHDALEIASNVDRVAGLQNGLAVVNSVFRSAQPSLQPTSMDLIHNITVQSESGGKQFKPDGSTVIGYKTLPDGTKQEAGIGKYQVTVDTGKQWAKEMGIPWDENRLRTDESYNSALGQYGLGKLIQANAGDPAKAWAAYNAGQGAVDKAMKIDPANWIAHMPAETQAYVQNNMSLLQAGAGKPQMMTEQDMLAQVRSRLPANTNPKVQMQIEAEVGRQYTLMKQAHDQQQAQGMTDAMTALRSNGFSMSALPISITANIPADKYDQVLNFAKSGVQGLPVKTNLTLYQNLMTDDNYLRKLTPAQLNATQGELAKPDFEKVLARYHDVIDPDKAIGPGSLNHVAITNTLNSRLAQMGIDTRPKSSDTEGNAYMGYVRQQVNDWVTRAQTVAGKKFNDVETAKSIDEAFAQNISLRSSMFGFSGSVQSMPLLGIRKVSDIPDDARTAITNDFNARGITPSDTDVLRTFVGARLAIRQNTTKAKPEGTW